MREANIAAIIGMVGIIAISIIFGLVQFSLIEENKVVYGKILNLQLENNSLRKEVEKVKKDNAELLQTVNNYRAGMSIQINESSL